MTHEIKYRSKLKALILPTILFSCLIYMSVIFNGRNMTVELMISTFAYLMTIYIIMSGKPALKMTDEYIKVNISKKEIYFKDIYQAFIYADFNNIEQLIVVYERNDRLKIAIFNDEYSISLGEINKIIMEMRATKKIHYDFTTAKNYKKVDRKIEEKRYTSFNWFIPVIGVIAIFGVWVYQGVPQINITYLYQAIISTVLGLFIAFLLYTSRKSKLVQDYVALTFFIALITYLVFFN
ncbi:MAG: hypothetical protein KKH01_03555 [Firmicutes bacterium]|nr:hypothetical protein [Bacillota bacterium]